MRRPPGNGTGLQGALAAAMLVALAGMTACTTVGPDYRRPQASVPAAYKAPAPWREARPSDAAVGGAWWTSFGDPVLDSLEQRALGDSPDLQAAVARLDQARAALGWVDSDTRPRVDLEARLGNERFSGNRPDQPGKVVFSYQAYRYLVPVVASYELDLWGRIRRVREAAAARVDATVAAERAVALSLSAEVALAYFGLRTVQAQVAIQHDAIDLRARTLKIVRARVQGGLASEWEAARADADLAETEAEAALLQRQAAELTHALAVLVGTPASTFEVPAGALPTARPSVPLGLPSDLLERRPDIAEAERELAARNAEIGVARAAYFPSVRLTGHAGVESARLDELVKPDSVLWAVFPTVSLPLLDGGRRKADVARAEAAHREYVAQYRRRLLAAFREVEDALAALDAMHAREVALTRGGESAGKAVKLSETRYRAGVAPLLDVLDSQRAQLVNARARVETAGQALGATVGLIRALGGGWQDGTAKSAPTAGSAAPRPERG
jgi:multidrug efflux system outer membrane protein